VGASRDGKKSFRVFISSPSDVFAERERVERVINRLSGEFGGGLLEAIRWERSYYTAAKTFQDQIPLPSETDLVICILWKRLGFELPSDYRRPDGSTPTGTEYEFEDAMRAARTNGAPDVLMYRKIAPVLLNADQVEIERAQFEALKHFWSRWFLTESGNFTAAFQSFETTDQLEAQVEEHIRRWLSQKDFVSAGVTWPIEQLGSPFRGLLAFDIAHAAVFFGRGRAVERGREKLLDAAQRGTPFLLVLGTSGSGKSSLVRAGLVPRLSQPGGAVLGIDLWRSCVVRPSAGDTPLHAVARALYQSDALPELTAGDNPSPSEFAGLLASAPDAAARAVRLALARSTAEVAEREWFDRPVEARLLLVVDQFEEALAQAADTELLARALAALVASGEVWVIITLRSDLYAPFQASQPLMSLRDLGAQLDLAPPSASELGEIIVGPAAAAGLTFDARGDGLRLDEELIEAAKQPGALPLLQLTLEALFEARDPKTNNLSFAAYDALGGLPGVVERRAEATLEALDTEAVEALPTVLRPLVEVTEGGVITSRSARVAPIIGSSAARRLVDAFLEARLLVADTRDNDARLRVAHDSLLSGWPRAAALIAAERDSLLTRGRVEAATQRWIAEGCDADYLLPAGRPLAEATDLLARRPESLDADCRRFVSASQAADEARRATAAAYAQRELRLKAETLHARAEATRRVVRRTRAAAAVVFILMVVAAGAALFADNQRREARRQTFAADRQKAEAERSFTTALQGGASLLDVVAAHLRDGGMTRDVARSLLGSAGGALGSLSRSDRGVARPSALLDTQSRLQANLSTVQLAVCDSAGAQSRAQSAVAIAEAAELQEPTDARRIALLQRLGILETAALGNSDLEAAHQAYMRAAAVAAPPGAPHDSLDAAWRSNGRDDALVKLAEGDSAAALAIFQADAAWQTDEEGLHPGGTEALGEHATDLREIGQILLTRSDAADAAPVLGEEATILHSLAAAQPGNLAWQRALAINIRQISRVATARGDATGALSRAQEAAAMAERVATHDLGNADWQRDLMIADVNLGLISVKGGDLAGMRRALLPALKAIQSLAGPNSTSTQCLSDSAKLHGMAGNMLMLVGENADARTEFVTTLALYERAAAGAPATLSHDYDIADTQRALSRVLVGSGDLSAAAEHDRAGITVAKRMVASDEANIETTLLLRDLRLDLGDTLQKIGDLVGAIDTYGDDLQASERVFAKQSQEGVWRHSVVTDELRIAEAQLAAHRPDEQLAVLERAVTDADRPVSTPHENSEWRGDPIQAREALSSAELVKGEVDSALSHGREAVALANALATEYPSEVRWRTLRNSALAYLDAADKVSGRPEEAIGNAVQETR
jgi:hypothetical protein